MTSKILDPRAIKELQPTLELLEHRGNDGYSGIDNAKAHAH